MIISRGFRLDDISQIDDFWRKNPILGIPSLNNIIVNTTIEDTTKRAVVGYGAIKLFAEASLFLDPDLPKQDKAQAVVEAMQTAILHSKDAGLEMVYAVAANPDFSKVLQRRYGFKLVPGDLLCLDLED